MMLDQGEPLQSRLRLSRIRQEKMCALHERVSDFGFSMNWIRGASLPVKVATKPPRGFTLSPEHPGFTEISEFLLCCLPRRHTTNIQLNLSRRSIDGDDG